MPRIAAIASLTSATSAGGRFYYPLTNTSSDPTSANWTTKPAGYTFVPNDGIYASEPITNMFFMFRDNATFNDPDISSWNVSSVTNMGYMFFNADAFNQDISSWDVSNVLSMGSMFRETTTFNQDISGWDVSSVTAMTLMFYRATAFNNGGVALNWGNKTANVQLMSSMFRQSSFNQDISSWNVSSVTNMSYMFRLATAFNQDISSWNVSSVTNMSYMFYFAQAFNQNLNNWDVSTIPSLPTGFATGATLFTVDEHPIWGTIFYPLTGETSDPTNATWRSTYAPASYVYYTTPGAEGFSVGANDPITSMRAMFFGASGFNNQDISSWDVSSVENMATMFANTNVFNQDISSWNVSSVTNMSYMFNNADAFNNGGVALTWTAGTGTANVQNMSQMFVDATAFNQDISGWNVSSVTNMAAMFGNADAFNQDISSWNVNSVTTAGNFSINANQKGTLAANWQSSEHPSNAGLGNFYNL